MRNALKYTAFPLLMWFGVGLAFAASSWGLTPVLAANGLSVLVFGVVCGLERLIPLRPAWNSPDGQLANDLGHALLGTGGGAALGDRFVDLVFGTWVVQTVGAGFGGAWPSAWPFGVQVAGVYLVADLGRYVQHRLLHAVPAFWRFHALHHSTSVLTVLKTSRSHLVERFFQQVFMYGPLVALGAPADVLSAYLIPNTFLGLFSHCNADLRLGVFEYVLMGPGSHRIHHSADEMEGHSNFGSALCIWDQLFGTYLPPDGRPAPAVMGIREDPHSPRFFRQLWAPFTARGH